MSILYQALSRAARDNARAKESVEPDAASVSASDDLDRPAGGRRSFRNLGVTLRRRGRGRSRTPMLALIAVAVLLAGITFFYLTLPPGANLLAEIPVVSDVAEMVGLVDPEPVLLVSEDEFNDFASDTDFDGQDQTAELALDTTPPAEILSTPSPGGGVELEVASGNVTDSPTNNGAETRDAADSVSLDQLADVLPAVESPQSAESVDQVSPDSAPEDLLADTASSAQDDIVVSQRETLEQTLERLANERGFEDLQPPVEIDHGGNQLQLGEDDSVGMSVEMDRDSQQRSFEAAYASLVAGNTESALNLYLDVLKDDPNNTFALFGLASTLQRIGWLSEARATYEELLSIEPDNKGALTNMMTLISQENPEQALANLVRLQEINPGFSPIPAQIGLLLAERGDYPGAIRSLQLAMSLDPGNMMYVYNLAIIHDRLGDHPEARGLYEQVLATAETRDVTVPLDAIRQRVSYLKKL